jgi:hypothetical protein
MINLSYLLPGGILLAALPVLGQAALAQGQQPADSQASQAQPTTPNNAEDGIFAADRTDYGQLEVDKRLWQMDRAEPLPRLSSRGREATQARDETVRSRRRASFDAQGLRVPGGFIFYPALDLKLTYDSNVFVLPDNPRGDLFLHPQLSGQLTSDWGRHGLTIEGRLDQYFYRRFTSEDGGQYRLRSTATLDVIGLSKIRLSGARERVLVDRSATGELPNTARRIRYDLTQLQVRSDWRLGRIGANLGAEWQNYNYLTARSQATGELLSQDYRDYNRYAGLAELSLWFGPSRSLFASVEAEQRRYPTRLATVPPALPALRRDTNGLELLAGIRGEVTPLLRGQLALGLISTDYRDQRLNDFTKPSLSVNVEWLMSGRTTINWTARRSIDNAAVIDAPVALSTRFGVRADHELRRNLLLNANLEYQRANYRGIDRRSNGWLIGAGASWLLSKRVWLDGRLNAQSRNANAATVGDPTSNLLDRSFDRYQATLGLRLQL